MKENKYLLSDWRSLELHILIAKKIKENPSLLNKAKENLINWELKNNYLPKCLIEWKNILETKSINNILKIITSETQNSARLRSSTPFVGILNESERLFFFNNWKNKKDYPVQEFSKRFNLNL